MPSKFKAGQWIAKTDVLKLGEVRWNKFREKYKSEHCTTRDFTTCGLFEELDEYTWVNVSIYDDGDLVWEEEIDEDAKQITYETILEYIGEKEMNKFDLKTQPWFICVNNEEESKAAQEWLFEQGMTWWGGSTAIDYLPLADCFTYDGCGKGFCWNDDVEEEIGEGRKEIKLSFETTTKVTNVIYPEAAELVELNGKKYKKSDLEAALSKLNPVEG